MTNPFSAPAPVYLPFSGTTDANGNLTLTIRPRAAFWFTGKMSAQVAAGSPQWRVSDGVMPVGFARGQQAEIAGLVTPPSGQLVLDVLLAQPTTAVTGTLVGVQAPDMYSIAGSVVLAPNTISAEIASPTGRKFLISIDSGSFSFALPPLLQHILCIGNRVGAPGTSVTVTGIISGNTQTLPFSAVNQAMIFPASLFSQTDFRATTVGGVAPAGGATVTVNGNGGVDVFLQLGSMVSLINTDRTPVFVSPSLVGVPAPWMAPGFSLDIHGNPPGTNAWAALITPNATQAVYLHFWSLESDGAVNSLYLSTSNVNGVNPAVFAEMRFNAVQQRAEHDFKGQNFGNNTIYWACDTPGTAAGGALGYSLFSPP